MSRDHNRRSQSSDCIQGVQPFPSRLTIRFCGVHVHVVEHHIATNENSLSRNPQHRVFSGVPLDVLEDLYAGALKCNRVAVEWLDGNNLICCTRSQEMCPFVE